VKPTAVLAYAEETTTSGNAARTLASALRRLSTGATFEPADT
jgi:hypothetical protein